LAKTVKPKDKPKKFNLIQMPGDAQAVEPKPDYFDNPAAKSFDIQQTNLELPDKSMETAKIVNRVGN
jgi:hypothetical protein